MRNLLLFLVCLNASAGTLTEMKTTVDKEIELIRIDREKALKPARTVFLKNLEAETKQWQAAGKLDLVVAAEGRKSELEASIAQPFESGKTVFAEENPIHTSKAEEQYTLAKGAIYKTFSPRLAKLDAMVKTVELMQKQLTQTGKTFEALEAADMVVALQDKIFDLRADFNTDIIVYEQWYRRLNGYDFMIFSRNGNCKQTYGPGISGEAGRTFTIKDGVITMTRFKQPSLTFKIQNNKTFEEGWKLTTLSEYLKAKAQAKKEQ